MPSGNTKALFPLHMAAMFGKIDPLELLVSAGFDVMAPNDEGQLSLHLCAINNSYETSLCATYLCLQSKSAVKFRDKLGRTPLHIAVARNNLRIAKILMNYDADPKSLDHQRRTCIDIAKENKNNTEMLNELNGTSSSKSSSKIASPNKLKESSAVDQERIMQVWERFFENAFKNLGNEYLDLDDENIMYDDVGAKQVAKSIKIDYNLTKLPSSSNSSKISGAGAGGSGGGGYNPPTPSKLTSNAGSMSMDKLYKEKEKEKEKHIIEWFKWLLLLDQNSQQYYVLHIETKETMWLDSFLKRMKTIFGTTIIMKGKINDYSSVFSPSTTTTSSSSSSSLQALPKTAEDAVACGWMSSFDPLTNTCQFLDIYSGNSQYYLPLGDDKSLSQSDALKLYPSDTSWVYPDYIITSQWVLVVSRDDNPTPPVEPSTAITAAAATAKSKASTATSNWDNWDTAQDATSSSCSSNYYLNIISGDSSWTEPAGWEDIVRLNSGFVLCCDSDLMDQYYWWCPDTNELLWPSY